MLIYIHSKIFEIYYLFEGIQLYTTRFASFLVLPVMTKCFILSKSKFPTSLFSIEIYIYSGYFFFFFLSQLLFSCFLIGHPLTVAILILIGERQSSLCVVINANVTWPCNITRFVCNIWFLCILQFHVIHIWHFIFNTSVNDLSVSTHLMLPYIICIMIFINNPTRF